MPNIIKEIPPIIQKNLINKSNKLKREKGEIGKILNQDAYPYKELELLRKKLRKKPLSEISAEEIEELYQKTHSVWYKTPVDTFTKKQRQKAEIILGKCLKMLNAL